MLFTAREALRPNEAQGKFRGRQNLRIERKNTLIMELVFHPRLASDTVAHQGNAIPLLGGMTARGIDADAGVVYFELPRRD